MRRMHFVGLSVLTTLSAACGSGGTTAAPGGDSEPRDASVTDPLPDSNGPSDSGGTTDSAASPRLTVNFDDGSFGPLVKTDGPRDPPTPTDPLYTVRVEDRRAVFVAPAGAPGPRLTGFLDLPQSMVPISTPLTFTWTFPVVSELRALGGGTGTSTANAGCYVRGDTGAWQGGTFGDYWLGFIRSGENRISSIRQGTTDLASEPFTAINSVTYRLEKTGTTLRLFASYDTGPSHQVGGDVTITVTQGRSDAVAITHVRVLDLSGAAVSVHADDFAWNW